MALIKCPECGKEISDTVAVCIHCGYPLENQNMIEENIESELSNSNSDIVTEQQNNPDVRYSIKDYLIYIILLVIVICLVVLVVFVLKRFLII